MQSGNDDPIEDGWKEGLRRVVEEFWETNKRALPLTAMPGILTAAGVDISGALARKKLLRFLQAEAIGVVALVRHQANPSIWGVVPVGVPASAETVDLFPPLASAKSQLADDAPWTLAPDGSLMPTALTSSARKLDPVAGEEGVGPKAQPKSGKDKVYATNRHPTVSAVIERRFFCTDRNKARRRLALLRQHFVFAKPDEGAPDDDILWIRGFALSPEEEERGYKGHYARITIEELPEGGFTLAATRVERPLAKHPQKARLASKHANWGHPFMRRLKKGGEKALYATAEEAQADLDRFHRDFPDTTIPGKLQLFAHVYVKEGGDIGGGHIQKIVVAAQENIDGNYVLFWRPNYRGIQTAAEARQVASEGQPKVKQPDLKPDANTISDIVDGLFDGEAE